MDHIAPELPYFILVKSKRQRAYDMRAEVFSSIAHDMMLEAGWQSVADRILGWVKEQNL